MYPSGVDDELRKKIEAAVKGSGPAFKQLVDFGLSGGREAVADLFDDSR